MERIILRETSSMQAQGKLTGGKTKPVICSDGKKYTSVTDAAESAEVHVSSISACCRGKIKTVNGKQYWFAREMDRSIDDLTGRLRLLDKYSHIIAELEAEEQRLEAERLAEQKRLEQIAREEEKRQQEEAKAEARRLRHLASLERRCTCEKERYDKANARALAAQKAIVELEAEIKSLQCS